MIKYQNDDQIKFFADILNISEEHAKQMYEQGDFYNKYYNEIYSLFHYPFQYVVDFDALPDKALFMPIYKIYYNQFIKNAPEDKLIKVTITTSSGQIYYFTFNHDIEKKLDDLIDDEYFNYNEDEPVQIDSKNEEQKLNYAYISKIQFSLLNAQLNKDNKSGAFFNYRLKQEIKDKFPNLLPTLAKCQIFDKLIYTFTDKNNKEISVRRNELKYPCWVYSIIDDIENDEIIYKMVNFYSNYSHISAKMFTDMCKYFNINLNIKVIREGKVQDANKSKSKDKNKKEVNVAYYKNHYFKYFITSFNTKVLGIYKKGSNKNLSSLQLVYLLDTQLNAFQPLYRNDVDVDIAKLHKFTFKDDYPKLIIDEHDIHKFKDSFKEKPLLQNLNNIIFLDFETQPIEAKQLQNINSNQLIQVQYGCCYTTFNDDNVYKFYGFDCDIQFLDDVVNKFSSLKNVQVYCHNLAFDGRLIQFNGLFKLICKNQSYIEMKLKYKNVTFHFKDSYQLITTALKNFPKMFNLALDVKKEVYPYAYYSPKNLCKVDKNNMLQLVFNPIGNVKDAIKYLKDEDEIKQFLQNLDDLHCYLDSQKQTFDMKKYYEFYCMQDVIILKQGIKAFRELYLQQPFNFDILNYLTQPSISNAFAEREIFNKHNNLVTKDEKISLKDDCYLYYYSGYLRAYLQQAVRGGRCMTKDNKRQEVKDKILLDFDACSLYPSAISIMFMPTGKPQIIPKNKLNYAYLNAHSMDINQLYTTKDKFISMYIVTILITKTNINRHFPLVCNKTKAGNEYVNVNNDNANFEGNVIFSPVRMVVSMIALQDLIKYQQIEFDIIEGVYWSFENKLNLPVKSFLMQDVITKLYNERLKYKAEGNNLQLIYKLSMNSIYGKSMQKPVEYEYVIKSEDDLDKFMVNHLGQFSCVEVMQKYEKISDDKSKKYMFKMKKEILSQSNNVLFGILVLDFSKRIMNEVICLEDNDFCPIYYQDTDSIHIDKNYISILEDKFEKLYNKKLIGTNLGNMHNDFDELPNAFATYHISLGKKMYLDVVSDGKQEKIHYRMKGIPLINVKYHANKYCQGKDENEKLINLYKYIYGYDANLTLNDKGQKYILKHNLPKNIFAFDILKTNTSFIMQKDGTIKNKDKFVRNVKCTAL